MNQRTSVNAGLQLAARFYNYLLATYIPCTMSYANSTMKLKEDLRFKILLLTKVLVGPLLYKILHASAQAAVYLIYLNEQDQSLPGRGHCYIQNDLASRLFIDALCPYYACSKS